ncbi:FAD-dependent oxidoreductase [Cochleicola gelatinilyticus]|nr:NAD(P)/FAD-dependent oxidoreductase [Cochleicola gelatinilyticus]
MCPECKGRGKKRRRLRKKVRLRYQRALDYFEKTQSEGIAPVRPQGDLYLCTNCSGSGLLSSNSHPTADKENYPHVAIIGGGIGGTALAVACLHRGIPFTLYERDSNFDTRSQGYALTLQQASKAVEGLGIFDLKEGVISTRHVVHNPEGTVVGEWGMRKWMESDPKKSPRRTNIHIARQSLRLELLKQLDGNEAIKWGHQFLDFKKTKNGSVDLRFQVDGKILHSNADLVVGADGIRSGVRQLVLGENHTPLRYLDCIVILGICRLEHLTPISSTLLDSATVFQTANGNERIYMMPYDLDSVMWQLSFPLPEAQAKALSAKGAQALKEEACRRTQWHDPIPQILAKTPHAQITGYPVYDRDILKKEMLKEAGPVTLIGDAAHPMSPFKGQGANQALLDALALAREISNGCGPLSNWKSVGIRNRVLTDFEESMIARSTSKVEDSAAAAQFLHSETVLYKGDEPRGRCLKRNKQ